MKIEKNTINNMSLEKIRFLLTHLKNIGEHKKCEILLKTIDIYLKHLGILPCRKIPRQKKDSKDDYSDYYEETERNVYGEHLGRLSEKIYEAHKTEIEILRMLGLKKQLKQLIFKLNMISELVSMNLEEVKKIALQIYLKEEANKKDLELIKNEANEIIDRALFLRAEKRLNENKKKGDEK